MSQGDATLAPSVATTACVLVHARYAWNCCCDICARENEKERTYQFAYCEHCSIHQSDQRHSPHSPLLQDTKLAIPSDFLVVE